MEQLADDRLSLEGSLRNFCQEFWSVNEPGRPFLWNYHLDAICEHLEAVTRREILRLIINVPPRTTKSTLVNVLWPAWTWTIDPKHQFFCLSCAGDLATRDTRKMRNIIQSDRYRELWPNIKLSHDQNQVTRFENTDKGHRISYGITASFVGQGGDTIIMDDLIDRDDALNPGIMARVNEQIDEKVTIRLNDPATSAMVLIMQRLHENDPTGHLLEQGGWEHLMIPMRYESDHPNLSRTTLRWKDPRTKDGELLWPERFPDWTVKNLENVLGPYGTAGQFQQRPAPKTGGTFENFQYIDEQDLPKSFDSLVRYWDKAGTKDNPNAANTAGVLMARRGGNAYVLNVVVGQLEGHEVEDLVQDEGIKDHEQWGYKTETVVEQEPGSGGKFQAQTTLRRLKGIRVRAECPEGSKELRAIPWSNAVGHGEVFVVKGKEWTQPYIDEHRTFPFGKKKDRVDASSGAYRALFPVGMIHVNPEDVESMVALDGPWTELQHPYNAAVGALFCNRTLTDAAFVVMGVDDQRQRIALLHAQRWQKTSENLLVDVAEIVAHVVEHGKRLRCCGIAYDPTQCDDLARQIGRSGLVPYRYPLDASNRAKVATTLLSKTRQRQLDLYRDPDVFIELCALAFKERSAGGYVLESKEHDSLPLGTAFAVCLHWSKGTMEQTRYGSSDI